MTVRQNQQSLSADRDCTKRGKEKPSPCDLNQWIVFERQLHDRIKDEKAEHGSQHPENAGSPVLALPGVALHRQALRRNLATQLIFNVHFDDVLERILSDETKRLGAGRIEVVRPACHNAQDRGVRDMLDPSYRT